MGEGEPSERKRQTDGQTEKRVGLGRYLAHRKRERERERRWWHR